MASIDEKFKAAVDIVQKLPSEGPLKLSNDQKLKFYSLYKQATIGDVNTTRPGFFSIVEKAKWDAWESVKGLSQDEAKSQYVTEINGVFSNIGDELNVDEWLETLDPIIKTNLTLIK